MKNTRIYFAKSGLMFAFALFGAYGAYLAIPGFFTLFLLGLAVSAVVVFSGSLLRAIFQAKNKQN